MKLPKQLRSCEPMLAKALTVAVPASWPEDIRFSIAEQPETIGGVLIGALHEHLAGARIAYLFVEEMAKGDRIRLASIARCSAKLHFLTDYDFLMQLNWTAYRTLTNEQRIALVDHELCHAGRDDEKDRFVTLHHDVEEFGAIVRRWGFWKADLEQFAGEVWAQLELLEKPLAKAKT